MVETRCRRQLRWFGTGMGVAWHNSPRTLASVLAVAPTPCSVEYETRGALGQGGGERSTDWVSRGDPTTGSPAASARQERRGMNERLGVGQEQGEQIKARATDNQPCLQRRERGPRDSIAYGPKRLGISWVSFLSHTPHVWSRTVGADWAGLAATCHGRVTRQREATTAARG